LEARLKILNQPVVQRVNLSGLKSQRKHQLPVLSFPKRLEVILKVSERCNINCKYCYFFDDRNLDFEMRPPIISLETIDHLVRYLADAVTTLGIQSIQIDLHGGEPLLMKKQRFDDMCRHISEQLKHIVKLEISLQTNGILIDDDWINIFEKYDIYVGVSLDGTPEINDRNRVDHKGRGTYDRVIKGIEKLQLRRNRHFSIISVITSGSEGQILYQHLVHKLKLKNLHFLAPDITHDCKTHKLDNSLGISINNIFDSWATDNDFSVNIRFLNRAVSRIMGGKNRLSAEMLNMADFYAFTVDSDGHIGPDDDLRNVLPHLFRGRYNVADSDFADFFASPEIVEINRLIDSMPKKCEACCWKNVCQAGSVLGGPVQRFSVARSFDNPSIYCQEIQELLSLICETAVGKGYPIDRILENIA